MSLPANSYSIASCLLVYLVIFNWEPLCGWSYFLGNLGPIQWSCFCQESIHVCFSRVSGSTSNLQSPYLLVLHQLLTTGNADVDICHPKCPQVSFQFTSGPGNSEASLLSEKVYFTSNLVICSGYSESHVARAGGRFTFFKDYTCCSMENRLQGQSGCWGNSEGPL